MKKKKKKNIMINSAMPGERNVSEEDYYVCCSRMNLSHEVLERVIQAIREEWQA